MTVLADSSTTGLQPQTDRCREGRVNEKKELEGNSNIQVSRSCGQSAPGGGYHTRRADLIQEQTEI